MNVYRNAAAVVIVIGISAMGCKGQKGDPGEQGPQGLQGPQGERPTVASGGGVLGTGTPADPLRIDLGTFTGLGRPCNGGEGTQTFDGTTWGPCIIQEGQCQNAAAPGCSAATASTSCKTLKSTAGFSGDDGVYWIDPDGAGGAGPFEAWCDMKTAGGGWTRVFSVTSPASSCVLGTGYTGDPRARADCAKLSDTVINQLATERIFYTQFEGMPKLFTKYTGVLSSQSNAVTTIGQVVNQESYAAVVAATASFT